MRTTTVHAAVATYRGLGSWVFGCSCDGWTLTTRHPEDGWRAHHAHVTAATS